MFLLFLLFFYLSFKLFLIWFNSLLNCNVNSSISNIKMFHWLIKITNFLHLLTIRHLPSTQKAAVPWGWAVPLFLVVGPDLCIIQLLQLPPLPLLQIFQYPGGLSKQNSNAMSSHKHDYDQSPSLTTRSELSVELWFIWVSLQLPENKLWVLQFQLHKH